MFAALGVVVAGLLAASSAGAQEKPSLVLAAGVGGTYYCIVSRCDTGNLLVGLAGLTVTPVVSVEVTAGRHGCPDCDRFAMADAAVQLRLPGRVWQPFVSGGYGVSDDPAFMGTEWGPRVSAGTWIWPWDRFGVQVAARGRRVGRGNEMAEFLIMGAWRSARRASRGM